MSFWPPAVPGEIEVKNALLLALLATLLKAQSLVRIPVMGFVVDARVQAVRPIFGIPGAARIGPPAALPFPVARAVFSRQGDSALVAVADEAGSVYLVRGLLDAFPDYLFLAPAGPQAALSLNLTGTDAVIYSAARQTIQWIHGLPAEPRPGAVVDASALAASVTALALESDGACAEIGVSDGDSGAVFRVCEAGAAAPRRLVLAGAPVAFAFAGADLLVVDRSRDEVLRVQNLDRDATAVLLAGRRDGVSRPVGARLSYDGQEVLVANAGTSEITVHSVSDSLLLGRILVPGEPTRLEVLGRGLVSVLDEIGSGPLHIVDEAPERTVYFVPVN